ncbi:Asp23/Gls24 family envelope stress response protein [Streptococcus sp. DD12]|uniref:Asp23/Gls24 family envelope stress response protein n=1 Tax=Streptococcus sp. DD12 TaxID=1777880 RepID=UPI00079280DF|nr:Asp23/Gls24 family envelope stress response protein [Streptococcus sp. DD12]KXT75940.1 Alkaline shock protein [Streptococcus sp. DD12]
MATELLGDIVISPRVLEVITGIATTKVEGVHSLQNKSVTDTISKDAFTKGIYLTNDEAAGTLTADIYVYLQYGVNVPAVSMAIQKAVKAAVYDMAEIEVTDVNIHVLAIVPEKTPKPDYEHLFEEDFLND